MMARVISAGVTIMLIGASWLAWEYGGEVSRRAGFEDIEILVQVAAVFIVLGLAESVISRVPASAHSTGE